MPTLSLKGIFRFDGRGLQAGLRESQRGVAKFAGQVKGLMAGAFTVGALKKGITDALNFADRVGVLATKLRTSRKEIQELDFALKPFGKDVEFLQRGLGTLGQSAIEALQNPQGAKASIFETFGISREELEKDSPLELIKKIGDTLKTTDFGGKETPLLGRLVGSDAADLVSVLQADIRGLSAEAQKFGAVMEDSLLDELTVANKQIANFSSASRVVFGKLASFLLKTGGQIKDLLDIVVGGIGAFIGTFIQRDDLGFMDRLKASAAEFTAHQNEVLDARIKKERELQEVKKVERKDAGIDVDALLRADKIQKERESREKELAKTEEEIAKIQFGRLSNEEKLIALQAKRAEIMERLKGLETGTLEEAKARLELEKNQEEIEKLGGKAAGPASDSLAKIGGFVGGSASRTANTQEQLVQVARTILGEMESGIRVKDL